MITKTLEWLVHGPKYIIKKQIDIDIDGYLLTTKAMNDYRLIEIVV